MTYSSYMDELRGRSFHFVNEYKNNKKILWTKEQREGVFKKVLSIAREMKPNETLTNLKSDVALTIKEIILYLELNDLKTRG